MSFYSPTCETQMLLLFGKSLFLKDWYVLSLFLSLKQLCLTLSHQEVSKFLWTFVHSWGCQPSWSTLLLFQREISKVLIILYTNNALCKCQWLSITGTTELLLECDWPSCRWMCLATFQQKTGFWPGFANVTCWDCQ